MRRRSARSGHDPSAIDGSSPTVSAGARSRAIATPGARARPEREAEESVRTCRPTLRSRPLAPEVLVLERVPSRRRPFDRVVPARAADRPPSAIASLVGASNISSFRNSRWASRSRPRRRSPSPRRARADASPGRRERGVERGPFGVCARPGSLRDGRVGRSEPSGGTDRDPWRGGMSRTIPETSGSASDGAGADVPATLASGRSSKSRSANAWIAASASVACGPLAATSTSCPCVAPSIATPFRLAASAGPRSFVRSRIVMRASNDDAVWTKRAAGGHGGRAARSRRAGSFPVSRRGARRVRPRLQHRCVAEVRHLPRESTARFPARRE